MSDPMCDRCRIRPTMACFPDEAEVPIVLCAPCALELDELERPWSTWGAKRLAWAYGCSMKGTPREAVLLAELRKRLA